MAGNLSKNDRREAAREQARQLREAQAKREKRNKILIVSALAGFLVLVAIAVVLIVNQGNKSALEGVESPAGADAQGGISVGADLTAGSVNDDAPVVDVYLDYTCHYCSQFEEINEEDLQAMATEGLITLKLHPVAILDSTGDYSGYTSLAANAAATVAQYAPDKFLEMNNALFANYNAIVAADDEDDQDTVAALYSLDGIEQVAAEVGVPDDVIAKFADGEFIDWVESTTRQFAKDGYTGTPTVIVDGTQLEGEWQEEGYIRTLITADE